MERSLFRKGQLHSIRHCLCHFLPSTVGWTELCRVSNYRARRTEFMDSRAIDPFFDSYYAPQIFQSIGYNGQKASLLASGVYGVIKVRILDAPWLSYMISYRSSQLPSF